VSNSNTIAITGGSGHLGTAVILEALEAGMTVRAGYSSYQPDLTHPNLTWVKGDLSEEALTALVGDAAFLVHTAAKITTAGDPDGSVMRTNVDGTRDAIKVCLAKGGVRLIHVSSLTTTEEHPTDELFDETRPLKLKKEPVYEYTKVLAEQLVNRYVKESDLDGIIVRPSGIFGCPDLRGAVISVVFREIYDGKTPALITGGYDFVDVRDVASGILLAAKKGHKGETYLLTGKYNSLKTVADIMHKLGGAKTPPIIPVSLLLFLYPVVWLYIKLTGNFGTFTRDGLTLFRDAPKKISHQKATDHLGYQPRPLEESLKDLVEYWKAQNK
jgi:dihydroflavonol-4-reductase